MPKKEKKRLYMRRIVAGRFRQNSFVQKYLPRSKIFAIKNVLSISLESDPFTHTKKIVPHIFKTTVESRHFQSVRKYGKVRSVRPRIRRQSA